MNAVKVALALAVASGVLLAGARAGGAFMVQTPAPASGYPTRTGEIAVGDALRVAGQPMQLSIFHTPDQPERVARFYLDAFRARGLLPVTASDASFAHVSAFDGASGLQRFVSAVSQPGGQTLVLIGSTHPRQPPRFLQGAEETSVPVPPGQGAVLVYRSEDGGARAESAQFVTALPPAGVAAFYRRALGEQGYDERRDGAGEGFLTFAQRATTISVALQALDAKGGAAVFVTRIEGPGASSP